MGRQYVIALAGLLALLAVPGGGPVQRPPAPAMGLFQSANDARYALPHMPVRYAIQYYGWDEGFQAADATAAWRHGTETYVELQTCGNPCYTNPVSLTAVTRGRDDAYLTSFARAVRAFGHPVLMTFDHEMNGSWYPWGCRGSQRITPAQWIAAWDHVTKLISAIAGRYVTWVWAPNIEQGAVSFKRYWPGHDVTWVGLDGYYQNPGSTWRNTYAASVRDIESVSRGRPFIVAEAGVPDTDLNASQQVGNLIAGARSAHAVALMYFDSMHWVLSTRATSELVSQLKGGRGGRRRPHGKGGPPGRRTVPAARP